MVTIIDGIYLLVSDKTLVSHSQGSELSWWSDLCPFSKYSTYFFSSNIEEIQKLQDVLSVASRVTGEGQSIV
jgi:hypothetical protein